MARRSEMPPLEGCTSERAPYGLCGVFRTRSKRIHEWVYRLDWNGNNPDVLPFVHHSHGIARPGWRCSHCGKFEWDQSDTEFALGLAHAWGLIKVPEAC